MAEGRWVEVPGKGRRWQQPSGELMMMEPGLGFARRQFRQGQKAVRNALISIGDPLYHLFSGTGPSSSAAAPQSATLTNREFDRKYRWPDWNYPEFQRPGSTQNPPAASGLSAAPGSNTPITTGLTRGGGVDRTQSDTYKQYAQTPEGQFQRYFQSPEMDQYFGATSRGAGAPKDLAAMNQLASQAAAPTSAPLASYYRAQSAAGRGNMEEVVGGLTYGKSAEEAKNLEAWARANPMLAFRQYNKQFPAGAPTMGGTPSEEQSFSVAANSVPAPWNQQGAQVDANRGAPALFSKQAEFTTGEGMPQFQTTLQKAEDFLGKQKFGMVF